MGKFIPRTSDKAFAELMKNEGSEETSSELASKVFENLARAESAKLKGSKRYSINNATPIKRK